MKTDYRVYRDKAALAVNIIVFIDVLYNAVTGIIYGASSSQPGDGVIGIGYFRPFTMDSNVLAGVSSLIMIFYIYRKIRESGTDNKEFIVPRWAMNLHLMAATSLFLTFLTVVFFLAPSDAMIGKGYFRKFEHDLFFYHFLNPALTISSFCLLCKDHKFGRRDRLVGIIPIVIYVCIYVTMVAVLAKWKDFYGFTFGGRTELIPIVVLVMCTISYMLSTVLIRIHNTCKLNQEERVNR